MNTGQIIRSKSTNRYVSIPNSVAQGKNLTLGERGLMLYLLSLPDDWVINKSNLHEMVNEKKGTVDGYFKGLQLKGFIVSAKVIDEKGHFKGWNHVVYDEPILPDSENHRHRFLPKSEITDIGKSCSIQNTNLKGLQRTKDITKTEVENFEEKQKETVPSFVEADRQKAREAAREIIKVPAEDATILLKNDVGLREILCMDYKLSIQQVDAAIDNFKRYIIKADISHSETEFRRHFVNWLPKNLDKAKIPPKDPAKPKYKNEFIPQYVRDQITAKHYDGD